MINPLRMAEFALALFGLFFMSGTLTSYLTPSGSETAPMVQVIGGLLGLYSVGVLLAIRGAIPRIMALYWPAVLPVLFAVMTLIWSEEPSLTLRRAGSLGLTTAFGFWLAFRFTPLQLFRLLVLMGVTILVVNFSVIQIQPTRGIHQTYDLVTAHHAGSWRGLFGHKNDFGRLIALTTAILTIGFVFGAGGRFLRWLALPLIGLAAVMITNSNSSQSALLSTTVPVAVLLVLAMRPMSPSGRSLLLVVAVPFAIMASMSAQLIFEYVLGLLGRDATLTGRTIIWEGVFLSLGNNTILGGGYGAGWQYVEPRLTALTGADVGHAHNGFLDLAVDIGVVGLGMTLFFMLWLLSFAFRSLMRGVHPEIATVALMVVIYSLIGNVAGSFLLQHNSLYWVVMVASFAMLRRAPYSDQQAALRRARPQSDANLQPQALPRAT